MRIGLTPVRVDCSGSPEVVWTNRIDPARAIIESVPTPETNRRFGDLVLHDGEPRGKRRHGKQVLSVFDELAVLEASSYETWQVRVVAPSADDLSALFAACRGIDAAVEDWTGTLTILCKACSLGNCTDDHEAEETKPWHEEHRLGVALRDRAALQQFARWSAAAPGREHGNPERLL